MAGETETLKTIYERRAVRKYKEKPVDHALIEKIIDTGRMAPSGTNKQPWNFFVLTNKDTIKAVSREITDISANHYINTAVTNAVKTAGNLLHSFHDVDRLKRFDPIFHAAPVVIFLSASQDDDWAELDLGMCAQNMMLAAKSLGLDSCPIGLARYVEQTPSFYKMKVPAGEKIHLAVILGYGDETPEVHERVKNNAFFIDKGQKVKLVRLALL